MTEIKAGQVWRGNSSQLVKKVTSVGFGTVDLEILPEDGRDPYFQRFFGDDFPLMHTLVEDTPEEVKVGQRWKGKGSGVEDACRLNRYLFDEDDLPRVGLRMRNKSDGWECFVVANSDAYGHNVQRVFLQDENGEQRKIALVFLLKNYEVAE